MKRLLLFIGLLLTPVVHGQIGGTKSINLANSFGQIGPNQIYGTLTNSVSNPDFHAPSVKSYGATGDGTSDDTAYFQAAANQGIPIFIPAGTNIYKITGTGVTLKSGTVFFGNMSKIKLALTSGYGFNMTTNQYNMGLIDLEIYGGATSAIQTLSTYGAIQADAYATNSVVREIFIHNIPGTGIQIGGAGAASTTHQVPTLSIHDMEVYYANIGFNFDGGGNFAWSEYVLPNHLRSRFCTIGIQCLSGNVSFTACSVTDSTYGFYLSTSSADNAGHSSAVNCSFNHNTLGNVRVDSQPYGYLFVGCQILASTIGVTNAQGVVFEDCFLSTGPFYFDATGSSSGTNIIRNCTFYGTAPSIIHANGDLSWVYANFDGLGASMTPDNLTLGFNPVWAGVISGPGMFFTTNAFVSGNSIAVTNARQRIVAAAGITIAGFANLINGQENEGRLTLSNSSNTPWTITMPGGAQIFGDNSSLTYGATLQVSNTKSAILQYAIEPGVYTNFWYWPQKN